jgi:hypothetical protein
LRPVAKGESPEDDGRAIVYTEYNHARGELVKRLGEYCSFCEMHLDAGLAVEHKLPKGVARYASIGLTWSNFLLACTNCNSVKGHGDIEADDYIWPDTHNTLYALQYGPGALVAPRLELGSQDEIRALNLIQLVGLDRLPGDLRTVSDRRWINRQEAWDMAQRMRTNLRRNDTSELRDAIAENAKSKGYFSVWYTVFADDHDMLRRIKREYPGTAAACFAADHSCVERVAR